MTPAALGWGIALGLMLGLGLWTLALRAPRLARPSLLDRVAPFVADIAPAARERVAGRRIDPLPVLGTLLAPLLAGLRRLIAAVLGGEAQIALRLRQCGSRLDVEGFRAVQALWGLGGLAAGAVLAVVAEAAREGATPALAALPPLAGACGVLLREHLLRRAATARMQRISSELPTVLEFLTLSLSAGEGIHDALRRVARVSSGELAAELGRVIGRAGAGEPLSGALGDLGRELGHLELARCLDHLIAALERGAPIVEVLRAQARDSRDLAKRQLLESAGRKEIAMLVPLVFLILPITVLFAVWPGYLVLSTAF